MGDESPDVDSPEILRHGFECVQKCLENRWIESGHDRSDGGLVVTLLEMAFAGNKGIKVSLPNNSFPYGAIGALFSEELGAVIEVRYLNMQNNYSAFIINYNARCFPSM